ncbi:MAG: T9SS type A sorting domain-containing protein, partial [Bacteroidetes bacterium]|nr:T9SS type A sorting domain-containing protein [Bacteroidota bacterium]
NALLGRSRLPYRQWSWSDAGYRLGGPQLIMLPNGKIFGGARFYDTGKEHTALFYLNRITYKVKKYVSLPSGGDNGYPGFAIFNDTIWISYYSSHEGKASIYLAAMSLYRITEDIAHDYDSTATGVIKQDLEPVEYEVSQNYPNPFNPSTKINYLLPQNSNVRISVFNALGQKVDEIHTKEQQVGVNVAEWNASTFATGMYMMRIEAASIEHPGIRFVQTKKMLLAK